ELRSCIQLPRHLYRAGSARRYVDRTRSTGTRRPLCHEATDRQVPPHTGLQRVVQRRPDMGDRIDRWYGLGRQNARNTQLVPLLAYIVQPWTSSRTELDRAMVRTTAGSVQEILCES